MQLNHSKKRILIIGDSLGLSRLKPEKVELQETWPSLLKNTDKFEIIHMGMGGGTIKKLFDQSFYYEGCCPNIVIVQSGIVDCAPRALRLLETEIINSCYFISGLFKYLMPINFMRKYRNITYTSPKDFKNYLYLLIQRFSKSKIVFIEILPASIEYEIFLPGISKKIEKYNNLIEGEAIAAGHFFLRTKEIPLNAIMSDFHHLNSTGHKWISDRILNMLDDNMFH